MNYLIIGNSAAGIFAAEAIREVDGTGSITVLTDEPYPVYSRCLTSYLIGEKVKEENIFIRQQDFYSEKKSI